MRHLHLTAPCSGDDGPADTERATVVLEGGEDDIDTFRIASVVTTAEARWTTPTARRTTSTW